MRSNLLTQICVGAGALIIIIVLYLAPRTPAPSSSNMLNDVDQQVLAAVDMVQNSGNPMQGILQLRGVAEENPENAGAQWFLGLFSLETGQFDKAAERFLRVIELDTDNAFPEAHVLMGGIYGRAGDYDRALQSMQQGLDLVKGDTAREREVQGLMIEIRTKRDSINLN
jgi:tetratricopeptide (TPR) repeat protein